MFIQRALSKVVVTAALALAAGQAHAAVEPCFIAFVHGAGFNDEGQGNTVVTESMPNSGAVTPWWPSGQSSFLNFAMRASRQQFPASQKCTARIIRYNARDPENAPPIFWETVPTIAAELNQFISDANIGSNQLIIITHSMGGLGVRFLINSASQGSGFFPGWGGDYQTIVDRTKYVITVQAPHIGTAGADAINGDSHSDYKNAIGKIAATFGLRSPNRQNQNMETAVLQGGSALGGWMNDSARTKTIFTIAGNSAGSNSGEANCYTNPTNDDCLLNAAWSILYPGTAPMGDGLVERDSAHGWNPSTGGGTAGFWPWLDGNVNHNQGRYAWHFTTWADFIDTTGHAQEINDPAREIATFGLDLPRTAQLHTGE